MRQKCFQIFSPHLPEFAINQKNIKLLQNTFSSLMGVSVQKPYSSYINNGFFKRNAKVKSRSHQTGLIHRHFGSKNDLCKMDSQWDRFQSVPVTINFQGTSGEDLILSSSCVMVTYVCQLDWTMGCLHAWWNIILVCVCKSVCGWD